MRCEVARLLACLLCAFSVAFAATAAEGDVQPAEGLKPMAFLAGHCWKGDFPDQKQNDEHCFQWIYAGKALRDTHTVHAPGRPDYVGETLYYWDSGSRRVEYILLENICLNIPGNMENNPGPPGFSGTPYGSEG